MHFDEVLTKLGDFGRYQKVFYFTACLPIMFAAISYLSPVFILGIPDHRCAIPGLLNDTFELQNALHQRLVQAVIPLKEGEYYSKCDVYDYGLNLSTLVKVITENKTLNVSRTSCSQWVYDKTTFDSTIVTEANLVCSRTIFRAHATTATDIGRLIGTIAFGSLSDKFGRKVTYIGSIVIMTGSSLIMLWLPDIWAFIAFRFILGLNLVFTIAFVYVLEFIGPSRRLACGMFLNNVWAIGLFVHSGIAYGLHEWRHLQLATSAPAVVFFIYWRFLPESPRWLFSKKKTKQGIKLVQRMAKVNGVTFDPKRLNDLDTVEDDVKQSGNICDLFKCRQLLIRTTIVLLNWLVVNMMYYGLTLNLNNLSGNIYLNYFYSALTEFAAYLVCIPLIYKVGRKGFHCTCMVLGGAALLLTSLPLFYGTSSTKWTITLLSMIGKMLSSAAYATLYLYTNELFPTVVRNTVAGIGVLFASVGGIIAPYLVELASLLEGRLVTILPMLIFGVLSVLVGLLALCLPETGSRELPDTIEDAVALNKKIQKNIHQTYNSFTPMPPLMIKRTSEDSETKETVDLGGSTEEVEGADEIEGEICRALNL